MFQFDSQSCHYDFEILAPDPGHQTVSIQGYEVRINLRLSHHTKYISSDRIWIPNSFGSNQIRPVIMKGKEVTFHLTDSMIESHVGFAMLIQTDTISYNITEEAFQLNWSSFVVSQQYLSHFLENKVTHTTNTTDKQTFTCQKLHLKLHSFVNGSSKDQNLLVWVNVHIESNFDKLWVACDKRNTGKCLRDHSIVMSTSFKLLPNQINNPVLYLDSRINSQTKDVMFPHNTVVEVTTKDQNNHTRRDDPVLKLCSVLIYVPISHFIWWDIMTIWTANWSKPDVSGP